MTDSGPRSSRSSRWPLVVVLVIGLGVAAAPLAFDMFDRAPKGKTMIDAFRPYMTDATIGGFQRDFATIDAAVTEARTTVAASLHARGLTGAQIAQQYPLYSQFLSQWPSIDADMGGMMTTMRGDVGDFDAVDALPSFSLFPWFFVAPGVLVAAGALWALATRRSGRTGFGPYVALVVVGAGLVAAPGVFQMWQRAPRGGHMIADFEPLMTPKKLASMQGYFITIAAGEGTLRNQVAPLVEGRSGGDAIARFSQRWPDISKDMAPMIGAMSDNFDNFKAVDALPPFPLFPWFFVIPGALVIGLSALANERRMGAAAPVSESQEDP